MRSSRCASLALALLVIQLLPSALTAAPRLPTINTNNVITITNAPYNAAGNGVTDNTLAISNAIVAAAAGGVTNGLVGGTVRIPSPGVFLTGPQTLKNNVNIQVDGGATLKMLPLNLWTNYPSNVSGEIYGSLIYATALTNLQLSGSGVIDGQGSPWWSAPSAVFNNRPYMIYFNSGCKQVLIQDVMVSNSPAQLIVFKGKGGNITVQNITELTPPSFGPNPSHNTDGLDLVGTNILVQNCNISVGDDNLALGTSSSGTPTADLLVTNCAFGNGHGLSIGSNTAGGVSNLTVANCTFDGTEYGIRMKSDDNPSGGSGQGGIAQNLNYYNIGMTNIIRGAIVIYSYYSEYGTPTSITPFMASTQTVDATTVPIWRNITISNLTASVTSGGVAGIIWGQIETPVTNVRMSRINITASKSFDVYNAYGIDFVDSQINVPGGITSLAIFNAGLNLSNNATAGGVVTIDGLTSTNSLTLYNAQASMIATNAFGATPVSVNDATLTISNNLILPAAMSARFALGTNAARIDTTGNLALNGTINLSAGDGFGPGTYTLFTYNGSLSGTPVPGTTPPKSGHAWLYNLTTNVGGQVTFVVSVPSPPVFNSVQVSNGTNLVMSGTSGATNLNYYILSSTNLTLPLSQWSLLGSNQCNGSGGFSFTNVISASSPQRFFRLQYP
jgi:polygalacturonase